MGRELRSLHSNSDFYFAIIFTVAIAADTALAIENNQNESSSSLSYRSNCVTLLITLTTDSRQQQTDSSDVLVLASCIDTVVTLHQRQRCTDNMARNIKNSSSSNNNDINGDTISRAWKRPITAATSGTVDMTRIGGRVEGGSANNSKKKDEKRNSTNESILVNSVWQAEIQERGGDQSNSRNIGDGFNGDTIGASLVDYAFVESYPAEEGTRSLGECDGDKELRWKHCDTVS